MSILHVRAAESQRSGLATQAVEFRFVDEDPGDGFSAWQVARDELTLSVDVLSSTRSCNGGYTQFALNRLVASQLIQLKPELLVVEGLYGCTIDLPRLAAILGFRCVWLMESLTGVLEPADEFLGSALLTAMESCEAVFADTVTLDWLRDQTSLQNANGVRKMESWPVYLSGLQDRIDSLASSQPTVHPMVERDPTLLARMQQPDVAHFDGKHSVLDLGCGVGIFLDQLRRKNIRAVGVERDEKVAAYGRGMGLSIEVSDALAFMRETSQRFDGIYCSHFVEHLPVDAVEELLSLMAKRLAPDGVVVLVFPDPESIRTQLLGFWRDPEHVRLYHPELVTSLATAVGLELEWSSYQEQPHAIASFPEQPPEVGLPTASSVVKPPSRPPETALDKVLAKLGLVSRSRLDQMESRLDAMENTREEHANRTAAILAALELRTSMLWSVNQTWAWNDNVTLRLRKRAVEV